MTTSSNTTTSTPTKRRWLTTMILTLTPMVVVAAFLVGYALRASEHVEAAAAKTDFTDVFSAPKCSDGELLVSVSLNSTAHSAGVKVSTTTTFDSTTGVARDILVTAQDGDSNGRTVMVSRVSTWEPQSLSNGRAGWSVTRYIVPMPTSTLLIKGSKLSANSTLAVCTVG